MVSHQISSINWIQQNFNYKKRNIYWRVESIIVTNVCIRDSFLKMFCLLIIKDYEFVELIGNQSVISYNL